MKKNNIKVIIKLQIIAGEATPAPPVGPALGQHGLNIMNFCKQFNDKTKKLEKGVIVPVIITVFDDKSFTFIIKTSPVSAMIKKAAFITKASGMPNKNKVGKITMLQVKEIAKNKIKDLNVNGNDINAAVSMIIGTAKSMGIDIID
jgi:large subunit ribosomal protein L11